MKCIYVNSYNTVSVGISIKCQPYKCCHREKRYQGTQANVTLVDNSTIKI